MGSSLRAELFYGYDFGESLFPDWESDDPQWHEDGLDAPDVYAELTGVHEADQAVEVGFYGAMSYETYYFLGIRASVQQQPEYCGEFRTVGFEVHADWDAQLAEWMKMLQIKPPKGQSPAWRLALSYG